MSRAIEAEHQPRTLRVAGNLHEPQRISRADEAIITGRVRAAEDQVVRRAQRDVAAELARLESDLSKERSRLRDPRVARSRQCYRDLGQALTLVGKVRRTLTAGL